MIKEKKNKIINVINNDQILKRDNCDIINTDYFQYFNQVSRNGIENIIQKIFQ